MLGAAVVELTADSSFFSSLLLFLRLEKKPLLGGDGRCGVTDPDGETADIGEAVPLLLGFGVVVVVVLDGVNLILVKKN